MENVSEVPPFKFHDEQSLATRSRHGVGERWRKAVSVFAALVIVGCLVIVPGSRENMWRWVESFGGLALVIIAALGRLWCAVYIGGRKNAELCTVGPYSLVRHPLYLFSSLGLLGILFATHRPSVAIAGFALFWAYHLHVIREEDTRLAARFDSAFQLYAKRVARVWPTFTAYVDVPALQVNLRPLRRAFTEVIWFFAFWAIATAIFA